MFEWNIKSVVFFSQDAPVGGSVAAPLEEIAWEGQELWRILSLVIRGRGNTIPSVCMLACTHTRGSHTPAGWRDLGRTAVRSVKCRSSRPVSNHRGEALVKKAACPRTDQTVERRHSRTQTRLQDGGGHWGGSRAGLGPRRLTCVSPPPPLVWSLSLYVPLLWSLTCQDAVL